MYYPGWNRIKSNPPPPPPFISKEKTVITSIFNIYSIYQEGKRNEWQSLKGRREEGKDLSFLTGDAMGLPNKWKHSYLKQQLPSSTALSSKFHTGPPYGYTLISIHPCLGREREIPPNLSKSFSSQKICVLLSFPPNWCHIENFKPPPILFHSFWG